MLYVDFVSIIEMLTVAMGGVFTMTDTVIMFTSPNGYQFTLLDMLLGALISEEILSYVMTY